MWNRRELKRKGKATFKANYWKSVLVALILASVIGGGAGSAGAGIGGTIGARTGSQMSQDIQSGQYDDGVDLHIEGDEQNGIPDMDIQGIDGYNDGTVTFDNGQMAIAAEEAKEVLRVLLPIILLVVLLVVIVAVLVSVFLFSPLEVGCRRFFNRNLREKAEVKEVAHGYDHNYMNNVKTLFLRDLYIILWSLLFLIPGIVKSYSYRMIPYLLADHPEMTSKEAFARSREMMNGNKWRAFILDLSFIGWEILAVLTFGILEIFYVGPYYHATCSALYEALEYGEGGYPGTTVEGTASFGGNAGAADMKFDPMTGKPVASDVPAVPTADAPTAGTPGSDMPGVDPTIFTGPGK